MWDWLRRIDERRRQRERDLIRFFDGVKIRYGDPFKIWRDLLNDPEANFETMGDAIDSGAEPETSICINAICKAFGVERWDPAKKRGLTDWQLLDLPVQLMDFFDGVKKNSSLGSILSAYTGWGFAISLGLRLVRLLFSLRSTSKPAVSKPAEPSESPPESAPG